VTRCHFDSYDNLLTQVWGYKFVRLYAPDQTPKLYPIRTPAGGRPELASASASAPADDVTTSQGNISAVNVESPDLSAHPLFASASGSHIDTVLGPGDALYIPRGWWHYVRSLTPSLTVNFWF